MPVISFREARKLFIKESQSLGVLEDRNRYTGRSTGIALSAIGRAMSHPGEKIAIRDHADFKKANRIPFDYARHIVQNLKLQCFQFDASGCTVTYDIDG
jgi:hypothetical protein